MRRRESLVALQGVIRQSRDAPMAAAYQADHALRIAAEGVVGHPAASLSAAGYAARTSVGHGVGAAAASAGEGLAASQRSGRERRSVLQRLGTRSPDLSRLCWSSAAASSTASCRPKEGICGE